MAKMEEKKFLDLYNENVAKIYRFIYFRVASEEIAQDLTSEVFLKAWQYINKPEIVFGLSLGALKQDKQLKNPRAFFYQIARNLVVDFYRQKDKAPISLDEITDKAIADKSESLIEKTDKSLEMDFIKQAMIQLSEDYQEVIVWRYLDELSIKEIAVILDKSEGAVRVVLSRALSCLKEVMKKKSIS